MMKYIKWIGIWQHSNDDKFALAKKRGKKKREGFPINIDNEFLNLVSMELCYT